MLEIRPIAFAEAVSYIGDYHRHHRPPVGWKFGIAVYDAGKLVGVATVGRPVARHNDDGQTLEVTRCCTDGTKNACSMLYASAWRAAKGMGYKRLLTYTLASESGASLRAAGMKRVRTVKGRSWSCKSRPREDNHPLGDKVLWQYVTDGYMDTPKEIEQIGLFDDSV